MIRRLRVTIEGKTYEVAVEVLDSPTETAPAPAPAAAPAAPTPPPAPAPAIVAPVKAARPKPKPAPAGASTITSPLAGKVVSIDCKVGQAVNAGDPVMTLEAMKMNTVVSATADGTIKEVLVSPGDSVEEGQPLINLG